MKEYISFFYNIKVKDIKLIHKDIYFVITNEKNYIFKSVIDYGNEIELVNEILNNYGIKRNYILKEKEGNLITKYENSSYVLMEIVYNSEIIKSFEMPVFIGKGRNKIVEKWESNIQRYRKILEKGVIRDKDVKVLLYYFIGKAEIAVSLVNRIKDNLNELYIQHRRISIPNYGLNYKDETNYTIDYKTRDLAEIVKAEIKNDTFDEMQFLESINEIRANNFEVIYFVARLIYPTVFFDELERYLKKEDNIKENCYKIDSIRNYYSKIQNIVKLLKIET